MMYACAYWQTFSHMLGAHKQTPFARSRYIISVKSVTYARVTRGAKSLTTQFNFIAKLYLACLAIPVLCICVVNIYDM